MIIPGLYTPDEFISPLIGQFKLEGTTLHVYVGVNNYNWVELGEIRSAWIIIAAALAEAGWTADEVIAIMKNIRPRET